MAINGNQWQSMAINGNQWQSMAISGNQWQSVAITLANSALSVLRASRRMSGLVPTTARAVPSRSHVVVSALSISHGVDETGIATSSGSALSPPTSNSGKFGKLLPNELTPTTALPPPPLAPALPPELPTTTPGLPLPLDDLLPAGPTSGAVVDGAVVGGASDLAGAGGGSDLDVTGAVLGGGGIGGPYLEGTGAVMGDDGGDAISISSASSCGRAEGRISRGSTCTSSSSAYAT